MVAWSSSTSFLVVAAAWVGAAQESGWLRTARLVHLTDGESTFARSLRASHGYEGLHQNRVCTRLPVAAWRLAAGARRRRRTRRPERASLAASVHALGGHQPEAVPAVPDRREREVTPSRVSQRARYDLLHRPLERWSPPRPVHHARGDDARRVQVWRVRPRDHDRGSRLALWRVRHRSHGSGHLRPVVRRRWQSGGSAGGTARP